MTDKEMAHEYAIENWEHYEEGQSDYAALKQAYLAGLKAGKLKWHKAVDGDLPKVNSAVLDEIGNKIVYIGGGEWEAYSEYYKKYVGVSQPFAWCEVPQYINEVSK